MSARRWNVAILGGGPAGCAAAVALERNGVRDVCIIDPDESTGMQVGETLPPDTCVLLDELGLWREFLDEGHEPCLGSCSSWGSDELGYNDFLLNPYARGWHVDRPRFDGFLRRSAEARQTRIFSGAKVVRSDIKPDGAWRLRFDGVEQRELRARYVVDATGMRSVFARGAGARPVKVDRLSCVYGFFEAGDRASSSRLTMLEASEDGWWYAAALPDRRVAVAFATDPVTVRDQRLSAEDRWFPHLLRTRHVAPRLDGCRFIRGSLVIKAAPSFLLDRISGPRWLAVGDAASCYDPLSSMGLYKALSNGIAAARVLAQAAEADAEIAASYADAISADFVEYCRNRDYLYALESRWPNAPFWRYRPNQRSPVSDQHHRPHHMEA